jgi:hypothetical protein
LKTSQQSFLSYNSNGTFVNQQKLQRNGAGVEFQHGDIVLLVGPPEHGEYLSFNHASTIPSFGFFLHHCLSMNYMLRNSKNWLFLFLFAFAFQKMLLHLSITMPTRESMLGITFQDDPIDNTKTTILKRKNTPYCKQYYNHDANKKKVVNNPKL